jgi:beta-galactosidase
LAQVILQSSFNGNGTLILKAKSAGLKPAEVAIRINNVPQISFVEVAHPQLVLNKWRVSPLFVGRPDAKVEPEKTDMNSWANIKPGTLQEMKENGFLVFKTTFKPYNTQQKNGGILVLKGISGKAEIWLDNEKVAAKNSYEKDDLTVKFPAKEGERKLTVVAEGSKGGIVGLGGTVSVETAD